MGSLSYASQWRLPQRTTDVAARYENTAEVGNSALLNVATMDDSTDRWQLYMTPLL